MALLGIGLKVATLPVIALGVGVGVDYGIYIYERMQHDMAEHGYGLRQAFYEAMSARHGRSIHRRDDGDRRWHLGLLRSSSRPTWASAGLHVPGERAGCDLPAARAGLLAGRGSRERPRPDLNEHLMDERCHCGSARETGRQTRVWRPVLVQASCSV